MLLKWLTASGAMEMINKGRRKLQWYLCTGMAIGFFFFSIKYKMGFKNI